MNELDEYVERQCNGNLVIDELAEKTEELGGWSNMRVSKSQGSLLAMLARIIDAKIIVELGTFTGYSALWLAAHTNGSTIYTCDTSKIWTDIAQEYWSKAGVREKIKLFVEPALDFLENLPDSIDFSFIDADKENYIAYYEALLRRTKLGGLIVIDDTLWYGEVIQHSSPFPETEYFKALNLYISLDPRVESVLLNFRNGLTVCRKREN